MKVKNLFSLVLLCLAWPVAKALPCGDNPPLYKTQVKGSHNSYHQAPALPISASWKYSHPPLADQLSRFHLRQLELDIYWNEGKHRFDVYHIPMIDQRASCKTFKGCLEQVWQWSEENPQHEPVYIFVEPKSPDFCGCVEKVAQLLDDEILSVIPQDRVFMPNDLQEGYPDIISAVVNKAWPLYDELRGHFIFILLDNEKYRQVYTHNLSSLQDRVMFAVGDGRLPFSAFVSVNAPIAEQDSIRQLVRDGFIVRARSDSDLKPSPEKRQAALSSGAQIISTDFVRFDDPSWFPLPGEEIWRCSPVFSRLDGVFF